MWPKLMRFGWFKKECKYLIGLHTHQETGLTKGECASLEPTRQASFSRHLSDSMSAASTFRPLINSLPLAGVAFVSLPIITTTVGVGVVPVNVSFSLVHSGVNSKAMGKMNGKDSTNRPNGTKISFMSNALIAKITGILANKPAVTAATTDLRSPKLANPPVCKISPMTPFIICSWHSGDANKPVSKNLVYIIGDNVLKFFMEHRILQLRTVLQCLWKSYNLCILHKQLSHKYTHRKEECFYAGSTLIPLDFCKQHWQGKAMGMDQSIWNTMKWKVGK